MSATALAKPRVRVPSGGIAFPAGLPSRPQPSAGYMRYGERAPILFNWNPALREANEDVKQSWRLATARTLDAFHNSGFLGAAAEQSTASVIGTGLTLNAKPKAAALGWTESEAADWAARVEDRFAAYAASARAVDARGMYSLGQLEAQAYAHWMATGEILATLPWLRYPGSGWSTKLKVLPAWRLSDRSEDPDLVQGVRVNMAGGPVAYRLKRKLAYGGEDEIELRAFDAAGRRLVAHIFHGEPDQVRGISPFAPVLKVVRQFDQLADATLTAALIQTVFAAMFKSSAKPEEVLYALQSQTEQSDFAKLLSQKADWYDKTDLNLGVHGKLLHGFPGDELQMFRSEHPNGNYEAFAKFLLLECSRVTAMTNAEFTGNFTGETYSSIQMGTAVNWPRVEWRREHIVAPLPQAVYEAWLEEDIESGATPFPGGVQGFLAHRESAAFAEWIGPTKPQADELKTAKAAETWKSVGAPDAVVFAPLGLDPDTVYRMRAREKASRKKLGVDDPAPKRNDALGDALVTDDTTAKPDETGGKDEGASRG